MDGVSLNMLESPAGAVDAERLGTGLTGRPATGNLAAADLWYGYLPWCRRNGSKAETQTWLGRRLIERKGVRKELTKPIKYFGIDVADRSLLDAPMPEQPEQHKSAEAE